MKLDRLIALGLCVGMALSVTALATDSAVPDDFNTVDYVDDMIKALEDLPADEDGGIFVIAPAPDSVYTVARGDSLWKIARRYLGSGERWKELYEMNRDTVKDPNLIFVGQTLAIPNTAIGGSENMAPPSPYLPCANMDEAAKLAGFTLDAPKGADTIEAWDSHMIQLIYGAETETMRIRKAVGSGDVSGDYTVYAQVKTVDGVTLKGESDAFSLVIWEKDGYTYSISVEKAVPQAHMMALVNAVR